MNSYNTGLLFVGYVKKVQINEIKNGNHSAQ
jgi:hypothetical protein